MQHRPETSDEENNEANEVTINAGTFKASDEKKSVTLALKAGLSAEQNSLLRQTRIVPRVSSAARTGQCSQLSATWGNLCHPKWEEERMLPGQYF
jgi:hypothetical protein